MSGQLSTGKRQERCDVVKIPTFRTELDPWNMLVSDPFRTTIAHVRTSSIPACRESPSRGHEAETGDQVRSWYQ